ncbi:MAG: hypothetical protein V3W19_08045 [Desulfatiglandales bacterium]
MARDKLYSYDSDGKIFTPVDADKLEDWQKEDPVAEELSQDQRTLKPGLTHPDTQQFRIEALRAASRIVAGFCAAGGKPTRSGAEISNEDYSTDLAEQFAHWLETGER